MRSTHLHAALSLVLLSQAPAAINNLGVTDNTGGGLGYQGEVSTQGILLDAVNLGHSGPDITVNGVVFTSNGSTNPSGANWSVVADQVDDGLTHPGIDDLFFSEVWTDSSVTPTITFTYTNLDPGSIYLIQVFHGEPRSCCAGTFAANTLGTDVDAAVTVPAFSLGNGVAGESPPAANDVAIVTAEIVGATEFTYTAVSAASRGQSIGGFQVRRLSGSTVFTGAVDNNIENAGNWSNGLPTNDGTNFGVVPDGFPGLLGDPGGMEVLFQGASGYSGAFGTTGYDVSFASSSTASITGALTVGAGASVRWGSSGMLDAAGADVAGALEILAGTVAFGGDVAVTGASGGVTQGGGDVAIAGALRFDGGTYTLVGGALTADNVVAGTGPVAIDFGTLSDARLNVLNANLDVSAVQALITGGAITYMGSASALGNFVVEVVDIGGMAYTQARLSPGVFVTVFTGAVDGDIGNPANWDAGLPRNDGLLDGVVPDGFPGLVGSPQNKNINFGGGSSYSSNGFGAVLATGYHTVFDGSGSSTFTNNGLFLGWDGGAAGRSTFAWNSTGVLETTRLFVGRFAEGDFVQSAGTVNQTNTGSLDFVIGELAGSEGSSYTMTGGTINAAGEIEVRRGTFQQSGGQVNAAHFNGIEWGGDGELTFIWTLAGGTLRTQALNNFNAGDAIDFPDGSSGVLQVLNSNVDTAAMAALVAAGRITRAGATAAAGAFDISVVNIDGVDYTQLRVGAAGELAITDFVFDPATGQITLTWRSRPGESYTLFLSPDLVNWGFDINDGIPSGGETTTFGPFDLTSFFAPDPVPADAFFRIMRQAPTP